MSKLVILPALKDEIRFLPCSKAPVGNRSPKLPPMPNTFPNPVLVAAKLEPPSNTAPPPRLFSAELFRHKRLEN